MLRAAVSYEVVRSRYLHLADFDPGAVNALLAEMHEEARAVVAAGAGARDGDGDGGGLDEARHAYMRYVGQGHEIVVPLPVRPLAAGDRETLAEAFDAEYARLYGRTIPGQEREILSWTLTVTARKPSSTPPPPSLSPGAGEGVARPPPENASGATNHPSRRLFDPVLADFAAAAVHRREQLRLTPEEGLAGPAVIVEDQTTTVVPEGFRATVNSYGYLVLDRLDAKG